MSLGRLTPLGWTWGLLAILAGLIVSFFLFGFFNPYWRVADQDILLVFDAFLQNDGLPRQIDFHPAHLIVAMLSATYRALHGLGFLETYSLSTMPLASDVAAFTRSWTSAVQIARLLSLLIVLAYVTAFAFLLRVLVADWRVALLGTFAIAFSGGIAMSVRSAKPELLSGAFFSIALLILLISARSPRMAARPMLIGIAASFATLAMDNKVQAIFLIGTLPVLLLPFGERSQHGGLWTGRRAGWALAVSALFAVFTAIAAAPLVRQGLLANDAMLTMRRVFDTGVFQAMLVVWIASGMLAFGLLWRVPLAEGLTAAFSTVAGISLGLLPLYFFQATSSIARVVSPLDALYYFVAPPDLQCAPGGCGLPFAMLFDSIKGLVVHHTFFLRTSPRPEIFLEWVTIAGIAIAFRRREYKVALQASFLVCAVLVVDTLQASRALKQDYFNYTDPLIIIAGAVLLAKLTDLQNHRWTYPIGATLIALHVAFSQAEPIKHALLLRSGPESKCVVLNGLRGMEPFPFCRT
jgi:hypothetical protein